MLNTNKEYMPNECEACDSKGKLERINGLWLCDACASLEKTEIEAKHNSEAMQNKRITRAQDIMNLNKKIDTSLQVRTEIFNANTVEIESLKNAINENPEISKDKKAVTLALAIQERINKNQEVIFAQHEILNEAYTKQRSDQSYLNTLANTLRAEERERIKAADINYKPKPPVLKKTNVRPTNNKVSDKVRVRELAKELNVAESTIQMLCVAKNWTPDETAVFLKGLSEDNKNK